MPGLLLPRQLARARRPDGSLDVEAFCRMVEDSYAKAEQARRHAARAGRDLQDSLSEVSRELKASTQALGVRDQHFSAALDHISEALLIFDSEGRILVWNRTLERLCGLPPGVDVTGHDLGEFLHLAVEEARAPEAAERLRQLATSPIPGGGASASRRRMGDGRIMDVTRRQLPGGLFICTLKDVTEQVKSEADLQRLALHDPLTGLPNRNFLRRRLQEALTLARHDHARLAVLLLDLDRFRLVNDEIGHPSADRLLQEVARRCRQELRRGDMLAAMGGDEFAILLDPVRDVAEVSAVAQRLQVALSRPFRPDGHCVALSASMGIALAMSGSEEGVEALLRRADLALQVAQRERRGSFRFYEPGFDPRLRDRHRLETDLRLAVANEAFTLAYQPLVDLPARRIVGAEALLRWNCPERGAVSPAEFIPLAEELGLINTIGTWVLRTACREAAGWAGLTLAVNFSPLQFGDPGLAEQVAATLEETGFPPERLEVEITEGALLRDSESTLASLRRMQRMGIRIALDDFGTGYSSLSYLRRFHFDKLKIDQGFVRGIERGGEDAAIVRAVVSLSRSLGMRANAEGVETNQQAAALLAEGCDEAQGWLFGRPVPALAFEALLDATGGETLVS